MDICESSFWDTNLTWHSEPPDVTPCFRKSVLALGPAAFVLLLGPVRMWVLCDCAKAKIPWNWLHTCKMLVFLLLIAFEIFTCIFKPADDDNWPQHPIDLISPLVAMGGLAMALLIVLLERYFGVRSSGFMFMFWFLYITLGSLRLLSLIKEAFDSGYPSPSIFVHYPLLIFGFILNLLVDRKPHGDDHQESKIQRPEDDASFLSKITFWWCTGLVIKACKEPLTHADIWPLKDSYKSEHVSGRFYKKHDNKGVEYSAQPVGDISFIYADGTLTPSSYSLKRRNQRHFMLTLALLYLQPFLFTAFVKLCHDSLVFIYPHILKLLIQFVSSNELAWRGYFYSFVLFFVAFLQSILLHQFYNLNSLLGIKIRSTVTAVIYRKSLKLSSSARKASTRGQIVNLMSADAQKFPLILSHLHLLWSGLFQLCIAFYFLWRTLGPSAFTGIVVTTLLAPANVIITHKQKRYQEQQMKSKDSRIKTVNEILSGIKILKLYAWESFFSNVISSIRKRELKMLRKGVFLKAFSTCIWDSAPFLISLATFAVYVLSSPDNVLDAEKAFVSLSLFSIMRYPLTSIPTAVIDLMKAKVSWTRVQKFLNNSEIEAYVVQRDNLDGNAIKIENGCFSWDEAGQTLSNINIEIKENSLVAIVGPVGSGKSSLLNAMLGELNKMEGSVRLKGTVSFVAQEPWIRNDTFQNNILFNSPLVKSKFESIVEMCALKPDRDILPSGNTTEIGEKGINLSGGQKQRLCLARALYKDTDIYLLDDPLSAVDAQVGKELFDKIIGRNGMLRAKTRILVTNGVEFLPHMDQILVFDNGRIVESGTFTELIKKAGTFADYVNQFLKMDNTSPEAWLEEKKPTGNNDEELQSLIKTMNKRKQSAHSKWPTFKRLQSMLCIEERDLLSAEKISKNAKLVKKEQVETGQLKCSVFLAYLHAVGPAFIVLSVASHIVSCVAGIGTNVWLSDWSDEVEDANGALTDADRNMRLGVYAALGLTQGLILYFTSLIFLLGSLKAARLLHSGLLKGVLHSPMRFFDATPSGRILNRFSTDVNILDTIFPTFADQFLARFFSTLAIVSVIGFSTPLFLTVVVPLFTFYCVLERVYVISSRQLKRLESVTWSPIYSLFEETIAGAISIRAFNQEPNYIREMYRKADDNQMCHSTSITCNRWLAIRLELVGHFIIFFASLFAVIARKDLSPGLVGLSITYALDVTQTLIWLVRTLCAVETNFVAVERIKEYTDTPSEAPWVIDEKRPPSDWPREGTIEFRNYETLYRDGLDSVLKGISCSICAGEKIGIVGRTGSGKTSMMLALFRIIEAARGIILVDGINISTIGLHDLRSRLTVIPQDPILFSGTLRDNLDPFGTHSDNELWSALEFAHLKSFISTVPDGLKFVCSEGGGNLSIGQRQLVCLARAFLRKTQILILDEATASVDLETDELIQATIRHNFEHCTVLTIAHRLNTIMDYTRIIVLDRGQIKEFDSPQVLLQDPTTIFHNLAVAAGLV